MSQHYCMLFWEHTIQLRVLQSGTPVSELQNLRTAAAGLKGYTVFCLDMRVSWPLSLVLSPMAMLKYQLLFRHLFFCRYVERSVCGAWVAHQACKELELRATLALSFTLRQKMLHFLQVCDHFCLRLLGI